MTADLGPFLSDNEDHKAQRRRVNWTDRLNMLRTHFPESDGLSWQRALRDNEVFSRVVRDILKAQQHRGRPEEEQSLAGRRPNLTVPSGMQAWRELTGEDYATVPFVEAFRNLTTDRSTGKAHTLSLIARKTNISRSRVHRLMRGEDQPDLPDMEMIATGYGRKPSYFAEYRAATIAAVITERLGASPEMSASLYQQITTR